MRKLATIRRISDIRPIEGADRIVVAQVDGWECIVKKDEFRVGDHIIYVEVDSLLPERPEFEFLRNRKFRVRTIKLWGQVSQGLVLPLSILKNGTSALLGTDVTDALGIVKYDPQASQEAALRLHHCKSNKWLCHNFFMRFKWYRKRFKRSGKKGNFPDWIAKTDENRIQNLTTLFEAEKRKGTKFSVTEKMDGQSATYYLQRVSKKKYEFGVCSRNVHLYHPNDSSYWIIAKKYNIKNMLYQLIGDNQAIVLQGEICGDGIQGNKYSIHGYELFVFNLIFPDRKCDTEEIANMVAPFGIKTVPIVKEGLVLPESIAELVQYSKGYSTVEEQQKREGIVVRNNRSNISFKVINPDFLLEGKELGC